jgi:mannose-1-phosphate guanylyltransferase
MLYAVIMAGGSGTRFWPLSREARPKQLLKLAGERTMIQATVDRLAGLVPHERTLVVTNRAHVTEIAEQLPQLPRGAIWGEPCKRDTAACIGWAASWLAAHDPDAVMAVMPADHLIEPSKRFQQAILQGARLVAESPGRLVTFGVRPTYPAESFGYIERGEPLAAASGESPAYTVRRFREKPNAETAREFIAAGRYYWNAGIFVWRAETILAELRRHQPELYAHVARIAAAAAAPDFAAVLDREFAEIGPISIDYAVMERAENVAVVEAPFAWDDVGSWQAVARRRGQDGEGNTVVGRHLGLDTTGAIVYTDDDHLVATIGLADVLVVHTPDATLVADKRDEQAVRRLVALLAERGWDKYL